MHKKYLCVIHHAMSSRRLGSEWNYLRLMMKSKLLKISKIRFHHWDSLISISFSYANIRYVVSAVEKSHLVLSYSKSWYSILLDKKNSCNIRAHVANIVKSLKYPGWLMKKCVLIYILYFIYFLQWFTWQFQSILHQRLPATSERCEFFFQPKNCSIVSSQPSPPTLVLSLPWG